MAGFGKRPWGSSPFGSLLSGVTGVPEDKTPTDSVTRGTADGTGTSSPQAVLSLHDFENAVFSGNASARVNPQHVAAYVKSLEPTFGTPQHSIVVLKAKTWSAADTYAVYDPGFLPGTADLAAIVRAGGLGSADLSAQILAFGASFPGDPVDLPASLQPYRLEDLPALLAAVEAANLTGALEAIPGFNLPAQADPVPGVDLSATGGGHFPEDVPAYLAAVLPVDLPVYIRGGFSDTLDLAASLVQTGQLEELPVFIKILLSATQDLPAKVRVIGQGIKDLPAFLQPYREVDLPASIITQRIRDMRAIITGFAPGVSDLPASVARIDSASFDMQAHTIAQFIELSDVAGKIRIIQLGNGDVPSSLTAVFPFFNVNKVPIQFIPLTNLDATLVQTGGHLQLRASVTPVHHESTGTADDAGFAVTASSYRFYLGTTHGLYVPPQKIPEVLVSTHTNNYSRPDLHATIAAWNQVDLPASISVYPYFKLPASLTAIGLDHLSDLVATVQPLVTRDLPASVTAAGQAFNIQASIASAGLIDDLPALLIPFVDPLALSIISVSTQPVANLAALINYDSYVHCSPTSFISSVGGYIKPIVHGTDANKSNLTASVTSSLVALDMAADVIGRKRTRIRILDLTFTAKTRSSERIRGSITPVHQVTNDLPTQITGLLHEVDLPATIDPVRYQLHDVDFTATESVANFASGDVKDVLLSFRTQVQSYVYEEVTDSVYATDRGTWAIDLRTLAREASFFDRALDNREYVLDQLQEFYSLDEAIRAAIVILCERRQFHLSASLTVRGAIADMGAQVTAFSTDRVFDLNSKIMPVVNLPDISATINTSTQSSGFAAVAAIVTPSSSQVLTNLQGEIVGDITTNLTAEITAT